MPKAPSEDLFQLIQSMDKNEKRYFKRFSGLQSGGKSYIKLFDAIDKQKAYNEEALIEKFKGEGFVKQFGVAKNYLYKQVIKCLRVYHSSKRRPVQQVRDMLDEAEMLRDRGLGKLADKVLRKAEKHGLENEDFLNRYAALDLQRRRAFGSSSEEKEAIYKEIEERQLMCIKQFREFHEYKQLWTHFSLLQTRIGRVRTAEDKAAIEEILKNPMIRDGYKPMTLRAEAYKNMVKSEALELVGDHVLAFKLKEEEYLDLKKRGKFKNKEDNQIAVLNNLLMKALRAKKFHACHKYLDELKSLKAMTQRSKVMIFERYYAHLFSVDRFLGKQKELLNFIPEIEKGYAEFGDKLQPQRDLILLHEIASNYMELANYAEALDWFLRLDNHPSISIRKDLQAFARILMLICHYELQNKDYLYYAIRSTYGYLYKRKRIYAFESMFMKFLRNLIQVPDQTKLMEEIKLFHSQIAELESDPVESNAFSYFDFPAWCKSKIEKRPLVEVIKEKYKEYV